MTRFVRTQYQGINEVLVDDFNNLTSSVAKMNEHILINQGNGSKLVSISNISYLRQFCWFLERKLKKI